MRATVKRSLILATALFLLIWLVWCWGSRLTEHKPIRIVVAGDDRAPNGVAGFNEPIAKEIVEATLKEKAEMLLWTGDLVNLTSGDTDIFKRQLEAWRNTLEPLYHHHAVVLPVRGNHEVVWYHGGPDELQITKPREAWNTVFSGKYALPANGPVNEKNLSFYYIHDSVLVIGLDQYGVDENEQRRHSVNQSWLETVLKEHKKPFIFVYGHEPAFMAGNHDKEETLAAEKSKLKRDQMWESLIGGGARVYFCGHDHFYDHMAIVRDGERPGPEMHQLTAGTAGAPMYIGCEYQEDPGWKRTTIRRINNTYGYILIIVDGNTATIAFKGRVSPGVYNVMDSFSYTGNGL